jgi:hypothetical protein
MGREERNGQAGGDIRLIIRTEGDRKVASVGSTTAQYESL